MLRWPHSIFARALRVRSQPASCAFAASCSCVRPCASRAARIAAPTTLLYSKSVPTPPLHCFRADGVDFTEEAQAQIAKFNELGWDKLPICMAKTQMSLSDDGKVMGRPTGFRITVRELRPSLGAGFIVALTGKVLTMPGLPKHPSALDMDVDEDGKIVGLF